MTIEKFRQYLTEMRAIGVDGEGREVLVGLTFEETAWYLEYSDRKLHGKSGTNHDEDRDQYLVLHDKHESARLQVLAAEIEKRTDDPTMN
jgi:hypothetical protein